MMVGFVFGWLPWDLVADFSPPSQPWLQTKWVVVGLGLPAWVWVWGLWVVAIDRLVEVVVARLPWVWLECEKKELFYNILI